MKKIIIEYTLDKKMKNRLIRIAVNSLFSTYVLLVILSSCVLLFNTMIYNILYIIILILFIILLNIDLIYSIIIKNKEKKNNNKLIKQRITISDKIIITNLDNNNELEIELNIIKSIYQLKDDCLIKTRNSIIFLPIDQLDSNKKEELFALLKQEKIKKISDKRRIIFILKIVTIILLMLKTI